MTNYNIEQIVGVETSNKLTAAKESLSDSNKSSNTLVNLLGIATGVGIIAAGTYGFSEMTSSYGGGDAFIGMIAAVGSYVVGGIMILSSLDFNSSESKQEPVKSSTNLIKHSYDVAKYDSLEEAV